MDLLIAATFQTHKINFMQNLVLKNNLKPATHFIDVWSSPNTKSSRGLCLDIDMLEIVIKDNFFLNLRTVAIFKIRLK